MDKQRQDAYFDLIEALLDCPSGEELDILNAHPDLMDEGLVETMNFVAVELAKEGDENTAGWLQDFATELTDMISHSSSEEAIFQEYVDFLITVIEATEASDADPEVVYPLLEANLEKLDENFAQVLRDVITTTLQDVDTEEDYTGFVVTVIFLCGLLQEFPLGNQANNIEIAIAGYEVIAPTLNREVLPEIWAMMQLHLGLAYDQRIEGNRSDNLERAIQLYQLALEICTREDFQEDFAGIQYNLALAYLDRIQGDKTQNWNAAISAFESVLEVRTREAFPLEWSQCQNNLGSAYYNRVNGERSDNIEQAINHYEPALQVYSCEVNPQEWALFQNNLGVAYLNRIQGKKTQNIELAISAFEKALEFLTSETFPLQWSQYQNNLGLAYYHRVKGERSDNIEQAINHYEAALQVYPREVNPQEWATIQNNLGLAYVARVKGDKSQNIELAILAFKQALEIRTREVLPQQWAETQYNLGYAYNQRIFGNQADNLEAALISFQCALQIYSSDENFCEQWAMVQEDLGNLYCDRIRGDWVQNQEAAIIAFQSALQIYRRETFPEEWAAIQNSLATIYSERFYKDKEQNLEQSLCCCQNALQVYTRNKYPQDWAMVQINLGVAFRERILGDKTENIEQAIGCYNSALQEYNRKDFPEDWAILQNNLANAYRERIIGNKTENSNQALQYLKAALEVYTRKSFPQDWALIHNNLALTYYDLGQIDEAIACFRASLEISVPTIPPVNCLEYAGNFGDKAFAMGYWAEAIEGYGIAIEALEQLRSWATTDERRLEILREDIDVYENMVQACVNHGQLDKAIEYVERSRSRRLVDLMASNDLYTGGDIPPQIQAYLQQFEALQHRLDQERLRKKGAGKKQELMLMGTHSSSGMSAGTRHRAALQAYSETIASLEAEKQQVWQQLRRLDPVLAGEIKVDAPDLRAMQQLIDDPSTAILSFYTIGNNTYIFVLRQNQITHHLCTHDSEQTLQDWLNNAWLQPYLTHKDEWKAQINSVLSELANRLSLENLISQHLGGIQELIIVPHLYLHLIPFAALPLSSGQYLGDQFLIRYTPSCQVLEFCQKRPLIENPLNCGIVEDATEDLPCASFEGFQVAQMYNIPESRRLQGRSQATVSNYRQLANQVQVLHSSHHAQSRIDNPLESKLELGDGSITLGQLMTPGWRLPNLSDVFLSCCETGLGVTEITDDILTLSTGFLCAGARSVVSTLWAVDDLATALFSVFYHQHRQQGVGRPTALQQAQKKLWTLTGEQLRFQYQPQLNELLELKLTQTEVLVIEAEEKLDQYSENSMEYAAWEKEYEKRAKAATRIYETLKQLQQCCKEPFPFSDPFYWAGFTCAGLR